MGLNQGSLAAIHKMNQSKISEIMSGKAEPTLKQIADFPGISATAMRFFVPIEIYFPSTRYSSMFLAMDKIV